jgi:glycine/D-amino acid oxidase-like deaminating enzyme
MAKDYRRYSYWLETCGDDLTPRPPLDGSINVDVAILGAGFTGLWTAYHLLQREPSLRVVVVEKEIAGFGASGRNGGWCFSGFPKGTEGLIKDYGTQTARDVILQMYEAVDDVGRICEVERIDAHYARTGVVEVARAPYHLDRIREHYETFRQLGLEQHYRMLDRQQLDEHLRVERAVGGMWIAAGATVQPARLARGLARAVERHGGTIYEQTRVTGYIPGPLPRLDTDRGNISARAIVLAGEAYLSQLPQLRRQILPMTSHMVITEPLGDDVWQQIGWERREVVGGMGTTAGYLNKTVDGRIAFGAYGSVYPFGSRITDELDRQEGIFEHARRSTLDWFPAVSGARFTHAWGGVFGIPRDQMPTMAYDRATGVARAYGYTGEGVATANLSGRTIADQITERDTPLTRLPMATHRSRDWEPEPLRWLGSKVVMGGYQRMEEQAEKMGTYPEKPTLAQRLFRWG